MRRRVTSAWCTLLVGGCALAGCGTAHPGQVRPTASTAPSAAGSAGTPQQRAAADAAAILASFVPPPGARRLPRAPSDTGQTLSPLQGIPQVPRDPVDDGAYWTVPGQPQAVLAWERAHIPRRFTAKGTGGPASTAEQFLLPPVPGVLDSRLMLVSVFRAPGGQSTIEVDAEVNWLPARLPSERVPDGVAAVTIIAIQGHSPLTRPLPAPVTVTNPVLVRRIAEFVANLTPELPGAFSCPMDTGRALRLKFSGNSGGPGLAVATANLTGCNGVDFSTDGKQQPELSGGALLAQQVLSATGLRWPDFEPR